MDLLGYVLLITILLIIAFAIAHSSNKDFKIKMNKLVDYLGGIENIIDYELVNSRFIVNLVDISKANKQAIQKLGSKGIVEVDNQLKIILDEKDKRIVKYIKDMKKAA